MQWAFEISSDLVLCLKSYLFLNRLTDSTDKTDYLLFDVLVNVIIAEEYLDVHIVMFLVTELTNQFEVKRIPAFMFMNKPMPSY